MNIGTYITKKKKRPARQQGVSSIKHYYKIQNLEGILETFFPYHLARYTRFSLSISAAKIQLFFKPTKFFFHSIAKKNTQKVHLISITHYLIEPN